MEKESTFADWYASLTMGDFVSVLLLSVFTLIIIIFVARTFRGRSDA